MSPTEDTIIFMRKLCRLFTLLLAVGAATHREAFAQAPPLAPISVDASIPIAPPETGFLHLGATSSTGHSLQVNSRFFVLDGKPWLPVMGELHYTRLPASEWEDEILKMKAGGVNIVSTYVFWIHHEEIEGQFDWTGRRDLRRFVELCARHGMYVWLRPGPWAHGEARNGGFPDWLNQLPNVRTNDPVYLGHVQRFFNQIGLQLHGLLFQQGGPVIGTQIENEYVLHGPGRGAEHIVKLKQLAITAGIAPPLFSVTGWSSLDFPAREVMPVFGGYPDGFWFDSQTELPPSLNYLFNFNREFGDMGAIFPSDDPTGKIDLHRYPYAAAEQGGGMASAYHRRPVLAADDIAALTLTGIGSGMNLYGYYMFHGGANPTGLHSTMQESRATGYPNDLPEIDYDFQAPLGAFGQQRASFGKIRLMHLFLNAFGSTLAPMPAFAPVPLSRDPADRAIPRVAVRSDGASGFLFVNNYVRQMPMPARDNFQVAVKLAHGELLVPAKPVRVPADTYFAWPINLPVGAATLRYSTAQLLTQLDTPSGKLFVFFALPGIAPEFRFDRATVRHLSAPRASIAHDDATISVTGIQPGLNSILEVTGKEVTGKDGPKVRLLLLTQAEAEQTALLHIANHDHLAMTASTLFFDGTQIHLRSTLSPVQRLALLPAIDRSDPAAQPARHIGLWTTFTLTHPPRALSLEVSQTHTAPPPTSNTAPRVSGTRTAFPVVPPDAAFTDAATWHLRWNEPNTPGITHVFLNLDYTGDIGRLFAGATLLDDNFFNGLPWEVELTRFHPADTTLTLKLLPMPPANPIYLDAHARSLLGRATSSPQLVHATLHPEYQSLLTPRASTPAYLQP